MEMVAYSVSDIKQKEKSQTSRSLQLYQVNIGFTQYFFGKISKTALTHNTSWCPFYTHQIQTGNAARQSCIPRTDEGG